MKRTFFLPILCFMLNLSFHSYGQESAEYLVFEGAGIRGIAYCGALMELEERGLVSHIKGLAGTSSGAITASLYAVGYSPKEIFEIIGETDFQDFNDGGGRAIGGFYRLKKKLGWYKGDVFLAWLEQLIAAKTGNAGITFRQLNDLAQTNKSMRPLYIAATSMNHQTTLFLHATTFPEMRIVDAVRASMAVPFYFEPLIIDMQGHVCEPTTLSPAYHLCLDGGFTANFCITAFDSAAANGAAQPAKTLGLRIDSDAQIARDQIDQQLCYQDIQSTSDLMKSLYNITKESMNRAYLTPADWARTISISDAQIGPKVKKLSPEQKSRLIEAGRTGVKIYCGRSNH
jgi:NTE family protein